MKAGLRSAWDRDVAADDLIGGEPGDWEAKLVHLLADRGAVPDDDPDHRGVRAQPAFRRSLSLLRRDRPQRGELLGPVSWTAPGA